MSTRITRYCYGPLYWGARRTGHTKTRAKRARGVWGVPAPRKEGSCGGPSEASRGEGGVRGVSRQEEGHMLRRPYASLGLSYDPDSRTRFARIYTPQMMTKVKYDNCRAKYYYHLPSYAFLLAKHRTKHTKVQAMRARGRWGQGGGGPQETRPHEVLAASV
jgi:hypothetical protein